MKYKVETYLSVFEQRALQKVEKEPAVIVLGDTNILKIVTEIRNQYYVASVRLLEQSELIDMLAEQYRLDDSQQLLEDLHLPRVVEVNFIGESFREVESGLFLKIIQEQEGVRRLLYSEDNYRESWEILDMMKNFKNTVSRYWTFFYFGFGSFLLLVILAMRIDYENSLIGFWTVFRKAGGSASYQKMNRMLISVLIVLLPAMAVIGVELILKSQSILQIVPEIKYHLIRLTAGIIISFAALFLIRKKYYE
jgi:hypothetical protein